MGGLSVTKINLSWDGNGPYKDYESFSTYGLLTSKDQFICVTDMDDCIWMSREENKD